MGDGLRAAGLTPPDTIEADGLVAANDLAREMWDEDGVGCFHTETLGRTDLIVCDEAEKEGQS